MNEELKPTQVPMDEKATETMPTAAVDNGADTRIMPVSGKESSDEPTQAMPSAEGRDMPAHTQTMPVANAGQHAATQTAPLYTARPVDFMGNTAAPQPVVQVPMQRPMPQPVLQRTGPNAAAVIFGAIGVIVGGIGLAIGLDWSGMLFGSSMSPEGALTLALGLVGVLLVLIAAIWALAVAVRSSRARKREAEAVANAMEDDDESVGEAGGSPADGAPADGAPIGK